MSHSDLLEAVPGPDWPVSVVMPHPEAPGLLFGRCAARSESFGGNDAGGGAPVIIGSAAGPTARDVTPRARGELRERAGNILAGRRAEARPELVGTHAQLRRRGVPVLDPARLPAGNPEGRDARMLWVRAISVITGAEVFAPAGAVYLRHRPPAGCVAAVRTGSTGLSAHLGTEPAVRHAATEIVERDALVRAWYDPAPDLNALPDPGLPAHLAEVCEALRLRPTVWTAAGAGPLRCVIACVAGEDGAGPAFGARCGADLGRAVPVAVYEALMVRWSMSTPAARSARRAMLARGDGPHTAVEHAVHAFEFGRPIEHLDARASSGEPPPASGQSADPVVELSRLTGDDVVAVSTELPGGVVVRVVAPGARQLPATGAVPSHPFG